MERKYIFIFTVPFLIFAAILYWNGYLGLNKSVECKEISEEALDPTIKKMVAAKQEKGVYLHELKTVGAMKRYLVQSQKELTYSYQKGKALMRGKDLVIYIETVDAPNDSDVKTQLLILIETKQAPDKIILYVEGKVSSFRELTFLAKRSYSPPDIV